MEEKTVRIKDEFIKLEQALKLSGEYAIGSDAKYAIKDGKITVNGQTELQRGKKMKPGDKFTCNGHDYRISGT